MSKLLKPEDVAERLHVSRKTALQRMKMEMRCVNIGNGTARARWVVDERDFERWLEGQKQVPMLSAPAAAPVKTKTGTRVRMVAPSTPGPIPYRKTETKKAVAK